MKRSVRLASWPTVTWSLIGLLVAFIVFASVRDATSPQVEVGQDAATVVAIMGAPTEKYLEPEMVDGYYVDGANVLVYRYHMPPLAAGDFEVYLKNGKVVALSKP